MSESTKKKILNAALNIFAEHGFSGARMQQIANEANINKAMLHYYFHSKSLLFEEIFKTCLEKINTLYLNCFSKNISFEKKIEDLAEAYLVYLQNNPKEAQLIINGIAKNPGYFRKHIVSVFDDEKFFELKSLMSSEFADGNIKHVSPYHLLILMLPMAIYPVIASNFLGDIIDKKSLGYAKLVQLQKEHMTKITRMVVLTGSKAKELI